MKSAFVTGANGFVGSHLCERLIEEGYKVYALARPGSNLRWIHHLPLKMVFGDLLEPARYLNIMAECDVVFHVAGVTRARSREAYFNGNFKATQVLVDALLSRKRPKGQRFVFVSSQAAWGPSASLEPIDENTPPRPLTWYGESKLKAQEYVWQNRKILQAAIACPPAVYGPRDTDVLHFLKAVSKGVIPQLEGRDRYASFIHVSDLARGLALMGRHEAAPEDIFFLAHNRPFAWSELARITLDTLGKRGVVVPVPMPIMQLTALFSDWANRFKKKPSIISRQKLIEMRQDFWVCSPKKAEKKLGFSCQTDIREGIRQTLEWYYQHGWL